MGRKLPLLSFIDVKNMLAIGALVRDDLDYYDTVTEQEVLGAPVILRGGIAGIAPESFLYELAQQADDVELQRSKPLYIRETLAIPEVANYWYHRDNEQAALLAVDITYKHADVASLDVVLNLDDDMDVDDEDEPAMRKLQNALGIVDEDDQADDDLDDDDLDEEITEEDDDDGTLEFVIRGKALIGDTFVTTINSVDEERARMQFEAEFPNATIESIALATSDDVSDDGDEEE